MVAYMMAVGVSSAAIYSVLGNIQEHSTLTLSDLNQGTGYMVGVLKVMGAHRPICIVLVWSLKPALNCSFCS